MKTEKFHRHLSWLLALAVVFSMGIMTTAAEASTKTQNGFGVKSVSLKIGSKTVTKKTYTMKGDAKKTLKVTVSPKKGRKTTKFTSSNKQVATVNKTGVVTAKKAGTAKITVTVQAKNTAGKTVKKTTWVKIKVTKNSSQSQTPVTPKPSTPDGGGKKALVVYFSCTENTKTIAEYVAESTDADLYRIEPAEPYTSADLNYNNDNSRVSKENIDASARPAIAGSLPALDDYDVIYLGYPIWWGQAPKILYTYVEQAELAGKTVIPFCTSASSGIGTSATNLQVAADSSSVWLAGKRFSGSAPKTEVSRWVRETVQS